MYRARIKGKYRVLPWHENFKEVWEIKWNMMEMITL